MCWTTNECDALHDAQNTPNCNGYMESIASRQCSRVFVWEPRCRESTDTSQYTSIVGDDYLAFWANGTVHYSNLLRVRIAKQHTITVIEIDRFIPFCHHQRRNIGIAGCQYSSPTITVPSTLRLIHSIPQVTVPAMDAAAETATAATSTTRPIAPPPLCSLLWSPLPIPSTNDADVDGGWEE